MPLAVGFVLLLLSPDAKNTPVCFYPYLRKPVECSWLEMEYLGGSRIKSSAFRRFFFTFLFGKSVGPSWEGHRGCGFRICLCLFLLNRAQKPRDQPHQIQKGGFWISSNIASFSSLFSRLRISEKRLPRHPTNTKNRFRNFISISHE